MRLSHHAKYSASFYASANSASFTAATTLPLDSTHASDASITLSSNEATVTFGDLYKIEWSVGLVHPSGNSRTSAESWLEVNAEEVSGTRSLYYLRQASYGASGGGSIRLVLEDGAVVRLRAARTVGGGSVQSEANACRLVIERCGKAWR